MFFENQKGRFPLILQHEERKWHGYPEHSLEWRLTKHATIYTICSGNFNNVSETEICYKHSVVGINMFRNNRSKYIVLLLSAFDLDPF